MSTKVKPVESEWRMKDRIQNVVKTTQGSAVLRSEMNRRNKNQNPAAGGKWGAVEKLVSREIAQTGVQFTAVARS